MSGDPEAGLNDQGNCLYGPQKGMEKAAGAGIDRTREIGSKRWRSSDTRHSGGILFRSAFVIYRSFIVPKHRCRNLMGNRSVKENYPYIQHQGKGKDTSAYARSDRKDEMEAAHRGERSRWTTLRSCPHGRSSHRLRL